MFTVRDQYTSAKLLFCCTSLLVCSTAFAQTCPPCCYDQVPLPSSPLKASIKDSATYFSGVRRETKARNTFIRTGRGILCFR